MGLRTLADVPSLDTHYEFLPLKTIRRHLYSSIRLRVRITGRASLALAGADQQAYCEIARHQASGRELINAQGERFPPKSD